MHERSECKFRTAQFIPQNHCTPFRFLLFILNRRTAKIIQTWKNVENSWQYVANKIGTAGTAQTCWQHVGQQNLKGVQGPLHYLNKSKPVQQEYIVLRNVITYRAFCVACIVVPHGPLKVPPRYHICLQIWNVHKIVRIEHPYQNSQLCMEVVKKTH